ncbi:MAG: flavodoxin-dependent (E)-4-hydroxy-3-methylbut-2-enyl-diphosphate synthase [Limnochordia bacterium]|jgi:(E)-4-hydroxy-3-methylbut-2-enyl-diphosphate synthase|nr:flavodoxin-dependent (E)-4-hydroxy-3-methylbut-2-enyl-diphosphate synthase [Bacillota bacterium]HOB07989.1 flavodoxin-dependent (E)-4-hydroxy-3-methylbut-2-enyl-diphosphate synthase [Limnochordia bacterium]NLH31595.1 flavodoxin-dependent (E)-4-hydroxy-3-methylbut-2-enyl-diphosphate synthase [Bacillota bacterium]HPT92155.1 flavodoxin-dependent (E)-4-hydroxy-3-methylbut-2-enyl-diphosphate synthase [Limnochordia bacterium]HPZ29858.1 flavodoxin-dependent (E)-4-hydroxy-3-methylbut-2-enyl-diphosph
MRRKTKEIKIGGLKIGGDAPITVQSMTNTDTRDAVSTVNQIHRLEQAGCDLVRVAVVDREAGLTLGRIKKQIRIPLVADIHFDYRLALLAIEQGVDKLRINPGNIGSPDRVKAIVRAAKDAGIPIRVGANAGSLATWAADRFGNTPKALAESALEQIRILEDLGFSDIVVSLKASSVPFTIEAYRIMAGLVDYPFHVGITEAGTAWFGSIKSAAGIGVLLAEGIGDTIRVSLTGDPVEEVKVGWAILKSLELRSRGPVFISCPTCGRTKIDLERIAAEVERRLSHLTKPIKIAVMGCEVNGPGEARDADLGIAGGSGVGLIFRKGKIIRKIKEEELVDALVEEALKLEQEL